MTFYFRCTSNRNGPLFVTDEAWEAVDMRRHPDYEELDADGNLLVSELASAPGRIPFHSPEPEAPKRKTLGLPKKA